MCIVIISSFFLVQGITWAQPGTGEGAGVGSGIEPGEPWVDDGTTLTPADDRDVDIRDDTPHLTFRDITDNVAYQFHLDTAAAQAPFNYFTLWRGTDAGNNFLISPATPLFRFDSSNNFFLPQLLNCNTIDTNSSGQLSCGTDEGGAGSGDPILIGGTAVTDSSGVDLIGGTNGLDIAFDAGVSPDTATFNLDFTEVSSLTWGAGAFTTMTFDAGATDPVFTAGNATFTIAPGGSDLIVSDDVEIQDATPRLRLTDTTAGHDDFEVVIDGSMAFLANVTDSVPNIIVVDGANNVRDLRGWRMEKCATVENLAAADDNIPIGSLHRNATIQTLWCQFVGTGTTPATITLEDGAGNAMTGTATCISGANASSQTTITAGGSVTAGELIRFDVTNAVSPETDEYSICYAYTYDMT